MIFWMNSIIKTNIDKIAILIRLHFMGTIVENSLIL